MPVHDWKGVPAGIFHDFQNAWIYSIKHSLNNGILPEGFYSLSEQYAGRFGPDVLTLQAADSREEEASPQRRNGPTPLLVKPRRKLIAETEMEFYRRKQRMLTIRHVSMMK